MSTFICARCISLFHVVAWESPFCPECSEAMADDAKIGKCLGCECKIQINRAHCVQCESELEEDPA